MSEVSKEFVYETVQASERRSEIRIQEWGNNVMTVWDKMEKRIVGMDNKLSSIEIQMREENARQVEKDKNMASYMREHNDIHRDILQKQKEANDRIKKLEETDNPFMIELGRDIVKWAVIFVLGAITYLILTSGIELRKLI